MKKLRSEPGGSPRPTSREQGTRYIDSDLATDRWDPEEGNTTDSKSDLALIDTTCLQTHRPGRLSGQERAWVSWGQDESWPKTCEASVSPCGPCLAPAPPSKALPQATSQSSRQPLCPGNGVHRQGSGSQGAQGQMRLRDHWVMLLPSKQGPPGWWGPTSSEPVSTVWPMPGSVSPGLGWSSSQG